MMTKEIFQELESVTKLLDELNALITQKKHPKSLVLNL
jgi:hypothetical protein